MSHNERDIYLFFARYDREEASGKPAGPFPGKRYQCLITESDIEDYPGMWIRGEGSGKISATWPKYPKSEKLDKRQGSVCHRNKRLYCKNKRTRIFPWRVFVIAENDVKLIESDLVYKLAAPADYGYKMDKPGQVAWDWWNANNIYGVDFRRVLITIHINIILILPQKTGLNI